MTKKGKLRNFTFTEAADAELLKQVEHTGKTMTAILEDLLLGRRQFSDEIEQFLTEQTQHHHRPRKAIIEAALTAYRASSGSAASLPALAEKSLLRKRKGHRSNSAKARHALKAAQG